MIARVEAIKEYLECPYKYKLVHIDMVPINYKQSLKLGFEQAVKRTIFEMCAILQESKNIKNHTLKRIWSNEWSKYKSVSDILASDTLLYKYQEKFEIQGLEILTWFRDFVVEQNYYPIIFNLEYKLKTRKHELINTMHIFAERKELTGIKRDYLYLDLDRITSNKILLSNDYNITVDYWYLTNSATVKVDGIYVIDLINRRIAQTIRDVNHMKEVVKLCDVIEQNVTTKYFYRSYAKCNECNLKEYCLEPNINVVSEKKLIQPKQ